MIIKSVDKNENGQMEVTAKLNYAEVDYLKGCIGVVQSHKLMDHDDPEQQVLAKKLKDTLLDAKGKLRP